MDTQVVLPHDRSDSVECVYIIFSFRNCLINGLFKTFQRIRFQASGKKRCADGDAYKNHREADFHESWSPLSPGRAREIVRNRPRPSPNKEYFSTMVKAPKVSKIQEFSTDNW
jgi:hypothetical protein